VGLIFLMDAMTCIMVMSCLIHHFVGVMVVIMMAVMMISYTSCFVPLQVASI
jgi:hypothetical protein